jgi:serine/threonine-protein kinase
MAENASGLIGGRYRVLGNLGKGAMGLVFMAHDPVLDRKVAIKQMTAEIADNEELRQRFYVEARAAARLNHPNIITIHELQESSGEIFMIMELLEGQSLAALIQAKTVPLSLEATLDVMGQVCDGLDYAHQNAIVHRDIKPANLFLTPSGTAKILDFGIARLGSLHMTATGALIGTPDYMAPEQIRGDEIDRRTDLWAVGAVLYQLLSGTKPFEGRPLAKLLSSISQLPHVPLQLRAPAVPKSVSDLVDRLLSKPREGRPATAGIVRDELRAILGRESASATKATFAADAFDETLVISTPTLPPAPARLPAAPGVAVPPLPTPPGQPVTIETPIPVPILTRTPAPASPTMLPPSGRMASTEVAEQSVASPAGPQSTPAGAAAPKAAAVPAPAQRRPTSRLVIAAVAVAIVGIFGLTALGGAAWWYFTQRGSAGSQPAGVAEPASATPPAQAAAPASTPRPSAETATAGARPPDAAAVPNDQPPPVQPAPQPTAPLPTAAQPTAPQPAAPAAQPPVPPQPAAQPPPPPPAPEAAGKPPVVPPAAVRPPGAPPVETGVVPTAGARAGVTQDTVDLLAGRQAGQGYDASTAASVQAAVSRINYVLEQYVKALVNADAEGIREFRTSLSPEESALMRARQLKVRLEGVRVEVNDAEATARCRRKIEGTSATGAPLQEDTVVVYRLVRKASGWVIADVR